MGPSEPESFHLWPTIGCEDSVGVCFEQGWVTELSWSSWALWGQRPLSLTSFSGSCMTQISGNSKGNQRVEAVKHERDALFLVNVALLDDLSPKNA